MKNSGLKPALGLAAVSFIAIGFMIGGGVFVFTGIALRITGPLLYQTPNHTWNWELKQISQVPAIDNMGDFMIKKITQLKAESIELLKIASCIGFCLSIPLMETI